MRVATKQTFNEVTSVGVFVNAGVRDETRDSAGAGHVIEQLALTGTAKRPRAKLVSEVESMGATLSATVGREQSAFQMSVFNSDLKQGVDILGDIVTATPVSNFSKEKEGIIRRLEERDVPTRQVIDDRLHACAFRDGPLGFSACGPYENLENLTEAQLKAYVDENYTGQNIVVAAAGPQKHEELVQLATAAFGDVKTGAPRVGADKPYFCGADLVYRNDEMGPLAYISMGWEAVPLKSPDAVTFMVINSIIGNYKKNKGVVPGNISGNRVINAVANKMNVGCAEEFESFTHFYRDTGMFGFYVVCDEVAVEHAVGEMMFGTNLMSFSVTDEEVERAKRELKGKLFSAPTSSDAACADLGKHILSYGRGIPPAEMILRIEAVDAEEVKRVAWKYLNDAEISITALGPLHGLPSYYELRRNNLMHRY